MTKKYTTNNICDMFSEHYSTSNIVKVRELGYTAGMIASNTFANRDDMEIEINGNSERILITARFDNLGKGAAGACSVVSRIDDKFLKSVSKKSKYICDFLSGVKGVKSITGMGLMLGIEVEKSAKDIANKCLENGLLVLTAKTKIRLLPALNISMAELDEGLNILKEVIEE